MKAFLFVVQVASRYALVIALSVAAIVLLSGCEDVSTSPAERFTSSKGRIETNEKHTRECLQLVWRLHLHIKHYQIVDVPANLADVVFMECMVKQGEAF